MLAMTRLAATRRQYRNHRFCFVDVGSRRATLLVMYDGNPAAGETRLVLISLTVTYVFAIAMTVTGVVIFIRIIIVSQHSATPRTV